ncbi:MAG: glycosyltransferase [bacterium]|nr:glycosyltransferase [bacterium]
MIRVYNEAITVRQVAQEIFDYGYRKIIFVNDGSLDESREILDKIQEENPDKLVTIIQHDINR